MRDFTPISYLPTVGTQRKPRKDTKQEAVLALLRRPAGATLTSLP